MITKTCIRMLAWLLVLLMAVPPCVFAQPVQNFAPAQTETSPPPPLFKQEELDQMLAPIALYPDSLLVQVLMAATYPLEIVEANRWAAANRNLQGDALAAALDQQNWDPSVKSVVNFPSVLTMMDQRLDWTQRLGDAFLSQKDQVMDTVQKLRLAAQTQGTLASTSQQRVVTDGPAIVIEPVDPQVVYVPAYDPAVVYGPWWYPAYPPYPYYPVGAVILGGVISFGMGIALGAAWGWAWGGFGWRHHGVNINVYQNTYYNNHINRNVYGGRYGGGGHGSWQHDPGHRRGVAYRDNHMAQRYGQGPRGVPGQRSDFRGRPTGSTQPGGPGMSRGGSAAQLQSERGRQSRGTMQSPRGGATPGSMGRPSGSGGMTRPGATSMSRPPSGGGMSRPGGSSMSRPSGGGSVSRPQSSGGGGGARPSGGGGGGHSGGGGGHSGGGGGHR
jgi:hypothetical protein